MRRVIPSGLVALCLLAAPAQADVAHAWVQLLPDGKAALRVIASGECAAVGASVPLSLRNRDGLQGMVDGAGAALSVCEATFDRAEQASVTVGGQTLTVPQEAPRRVAVIGDTGCRKEHPDSGQRCAAPDWIFDTVAQGVAAAGPDLVVHVGDFVYQWNCWNGDEGCGTESQLREWEYWQSDFFSKAKTLLPAAPWVFVRGNHEDCRQTDRGWRGWSIFFAPEGPEDNQGTCATDQAADLSYMISLPGGTAPALDLLVYDSADEVPFNASDFALAEGRSDAVWLLTHVPLWSVYQTYDDSLPDSVQMVLSGHEHLFEMVQASAWDPPQLVVGGSGTKLEAPHRRPRYHLFEMDFYNFSFVIIDRPASGPLVVTECIVPASGQVQAAKSWTVQGRTISAITAVQDACVPS